MCETPPRSPTIVGIEVETMVWSRAAMSMPARSAEKIRVTRRCVRTIGTAGADCGACTRSPRSVELERSGGSGETGGQRGPRLVDEVGQRGGEVGGQPAVQR